ncbi:MAG: hypothetical protein ISS31_05005 [Kiritimatiellae bacterium]|nr:hypothetical protein [Kiritimatiellia bacterium]
MKAAEYWTDRYDVEWTSPSDNGPMDSMPFGGGDVGCNIWVEKGDVLLYVQKSGSFNELGEYVKLGRFRLTFTPNPFEESAAFSQKLRLQDGSVTITARGKKSTCDFKLELKCWADVLTGSIHLVVESTRPVAYRVRYETWRHRDRLLEETARVQKMGDSSRFGSYSFVGYPGEVKKLKDEFRYDGSTILFYHRNPESPMAPNVGIEQQDLAAYKDQLYDGNKNLTFGGKIIGSHAIKSEGGDGNYRGIDFKYLALESKGTSAKHHIMIATHRARDAVFANWKKRLDDRCGQVQRTRGNVVKNRRWWRNFWDRSRVVVKPKDRDATDPVWKLGLYYQLGRYQFGCNYYGDSPTKFNGGSFTVDPFGKPFDPDWRCWGGDFHRAQNQRLIYWPMLKMGDAGAMRAQFNLYRRGLPGATIRVKKYFGHEGALYAENTDATGLAFPLAWCWPPNGFSAEKRIRPQEVPFGDARITGFTKGLVERGMMYSASIGYHFTSQLEHAYMILEFHRFTGGSIEKYLPFIKQSVIFFDQHYQKRQMLRNGKPFDERGKLYIYPAMACETGNMPNPADVVAGLEACLEGLIALESALVTNEEKDYYRAFLDRLPPTPFLREHGGHTMLASGEGNNRTGGTRELPQFYPLFPFNRITPADKEEMEIARETWRHDTTIDLNSIYGWQQKNIFAARVGLPGDAMALNVKKMNNANKKMRFPSFFGPAYDGMPDHNWIGAGMIGIQEMLLQTFGDKIYVLPAWPVDVDVDFKLHAPQQTVVEVSFRDGEIRRLDVTPEEREKDVIVVPEL